LLCERNQLQENKNSTKEPFRRNDMIEGADIIKAAAFLGAGISMGVGAIGPGVGEGMAAAKACEAIGKNPKEAGLLTRTMLVGQAVSESTGIYSLVIALLLLFVV
jgi:F-type H+-transporting ATPase subunit c